MTSQMEKEDAQTLEFFSSFEYVTAEARLPSNLPAGTYDLSGCPATEDPAVLVERFDNVVRVWGVFGRPFKGRGYFTLLGPDETVYIPVGGVYTQWDKEAGQPHIHLPMFRLLSVQMDRNCRVRIIGEQNAGKLYAAVGVTFVKAKKA